MQTSRANPNTIKPLRVGCVSYLNTKPLIYGLENQPDIQLSLRVPARLIDGLHDGLFDVALLPTIDYQRFDDLLVVPAGGIGCDGPTLTVRIFSTIPIEKITTLVCDVESHTSVALARIILAELYGIQPKFTLLPGTHGEPPLTPSPCNQGEGWGEAPSSAMLLIGDKVVCQEPPDHPYQLDLGSAWKDLTGMPFVFAVWVARNGIFLHDLPARLATARQTGLAHADEIVRQYAVPRGWPADLALQYLTGYLKYEIGEKQLATITRFHELAAKYGLIPDPPRPLRIYR